MTQLLERTQTAEMCSIEVQLEDQRRLIRLENALANRGLECKRLEPECLETKLFEIEWLRTETLESEGSKLSD